MWLGLKQESAAFWWVCIYVFFEYVRPQQIYPEIDVLPWPQIALLMAVITTYIDKKVIWVKSVENRFVVMFSVVVAMSIVFAFRPSTSWAYINEVVNWIIIYFLIISVVNTEKRFFIFVLLFLLASFKMSQHGFRTFAGRGFSFASHGVSGPPGWFANSSEFGIQMAIYVPLAMAFVASLRQYWGRIKKLFFYLMPFTGIFTIAATSSRGAQLAIAGVGIWFIIKSRLGLKAMAGILLLGWILYMVIPPAQLARFESMGEDETSASRLLYWDIGMGVFADNPLLGVGFRSWRDYCASVVNMNVEGERLACLEVHNTYIQAAVELGIGGIVLFLLMIIYVFVLNARTRNYARTNENKFILYMAHGLDGGLIGLIISGTFVSVLWYPFFWFQMGMAVALNEISRRQALLITSDSKNTVMHRYKHSAV